MVAMLAESWEKKSVMFLYWSKTTCNKVLSNRPLLHFQFKLSELKGLVSCYGINDSAVSNCEVKHVVSRVPASDNITWEDVWLKLELLAVSAPCGKGNGCQSYDGKSKVVKLCYHFTDSSCIHHNLLACIWIQFVQLINTVIDVICAI
jgi:hypothetical protein